VKVNYVICFFVFVSCAEAFGFEWPQLFESRPRGTISSAIDARLAEGHIEKKDLYSAEKLYLSALESDPLNVFLRMNLGVVYEVQKKYEAAGKEYAVVANDETLDPELRALANFNLGNARASDKKVDGAISAYQMAFDLTLDPDLKTKIKNNIEVLMKNSQGGGQSEGEGDGKTGENQDNKDKKDGKQKQPQDPQDQPNQEKPQQGKHMSKQDLERILEELKSQEQKIRAMEFGKGDKSPGPEKDW
jgi:Ca-activated chloride channel family protein